MDDDKKVKPIPGMDEDTSSESATRARNRTVMLTPDITGQVRARLQQEIGQTGENDFITPQVLNRGQPPSSPRMLGAQESFVPPSATSPQQPPITPAQVAQKKATAVQKNPLVGFLVSFDHGPTGEYYELRTGRIIITSDEVGAGNHLVIPDETVSPMHAILRVSPSSEIQVLDQLSEHGTWIKRFGATTEDQLSGDKSTLEHGDTIRFGNRSFVLCVIFRAEE